MEKIVPQSVGELFRWKFAGDAVLGGDTDSNTGEITIDSTLVLYCHLHDQAKNEWLRK